MIARQLFARTAAASSQEGGSPGRRADTAALREVARRREMVGILTASRRGETNEEIARALPPKSSPIYQAAIWVLVAATSLVLFHTLWFVGELLLTVKWRTPGSEQMALWRGVATLLFELSLPACGYLGATHGNRHLACCFCGCSLFVTSVVFIGLALTLLTSLGSVDLADVVLQSNKELLIILLYTLSFWFGMQLHSLLMLRQSSDYHLTSLVPLVGQVIQVRPPHWAGWAWTSDQPAAAAAAAAAAGAPGIAPTNLDQSAARVPGTATNLDQSA